MWLCNTRQKIKNFRKTSSNNFLNASQTFGVVSSLLQIPPCGLNFTVSLTWFRLEVVALLFPFCGIRLSVSVLCFGCCGLCNAATSLRIPYLVFPIVTSAMRFSLCVFFNETFSILVSCFSFCLPVFVLLASNFCF